MIDNCTGCGRTGYVYNPSITIEWDVILTKGDVFLDDGLCPTCKKNKEVTRMSDGVSEASKAEQAQRLKYLEVIDWVSKRAKVFAENYPKWSWEVAHHEAKKAYNEEVELYWLGLEAGPTLRSPLDIAEALHKTEVDKAISVGKTEADVSIKVPSVADMEKSMEYTGMLTEAYKRVAGLDDYNASRLAGDGINVIDETNIPKSKWIANYIAQDISSRTTADILDEAEHIWEASQKLLASKPWDSKPRGELISYGKDNLPTHIISKSGYEGSTVACSHDAREYQPIAEVLEDIRSQVATVDEYLNKIYVDLTGGRLLHAGECSSSESSIRDAVEDLRRDASGLIRLALAIRDVTYRP